MKLFHLSPSRRRRNLTLQRSSIRSFQTYVLAERVFLKTLSRVVTRNYPSSLINFREEGFFISYKFVKSKIFSARRERLIYGRNIGDIGEK